MSSYPRVRARDRPAKSVNSPSAPTPPNQLRADRLHLAPANRSTSAAPTTSARAHSARRSQSGADPYSHSRLICIPRSPSNRRRLPATSMYQRDHERPRRPGSLMRKLALRVGRQSCPCVRQRFPKRCIRPTSGRLPATSIIWRNLRGVDPRSGRRRASAPDWQRAVRPCYASRMATFTYSRAVFDVPDETAARRIIMTPEFGQDTGPWTVAGIDRRAGRNRRGDLGRECGFEGRWCRGRRADQPLGRRASDRGGRAEAAVYAGCAEIELRSGLRADD